MLLKSMEMPPDPTIHLTQNELMEKFNLAFYEGQNLSKSDILATFNENEIKDDYLIDYLMSPNQVVSPPTPINTEIDFDFTDFVDIFDRNLSEHTPPPSTITSNSILSEEEEEEEDEDDDVFDLEPSAILSDILNLNDIEIQNFDVFDGNLAINQESCDFLPPINTITRNNFDFNQFIRTAPENDLHFTPNTNYQHEFGHLIGSKQLPLNNNYPEDVASNDFGQENHLILTQSEALLHQTDDPLLSSSSLMYPTMKKTRNFSESDETGDDDASITSSEQQQLICQWENCYQTYDSQTTLVKHIEKTHVEVKRGDEFTCFWSNCPRKIKPFNARYKLLIHMRVHSGEKPNKCPFEGCNKAFSRLENLKIHQRSHTGERPYLCQFPTCTKSFSNSSDRAKHQRTHFDTKPYACQVVGCMKKYTDPSSLRKHVKNHSNEEQMLIKRKNDESSSTTLPTNTSYIRKFLDLNRQKAIKSFDTYKNPSFEHNYSNTLQCNKNLMSIKQDLKNKISEKNKLLRKFSY